MVQFQFYPYPLKKAAIGSVRVEVRKLKNGYARLAGRLDRLFAATSAKKPKRKKKEVFCL